MWRTVKGKKDKRGIVAETVGELKKMLEYVPDDYALSVIGCKFGMLMDIEGKYILMDEVPYLEDLLSEQDERIERCKDCACLIEKNGMYYCDEKQEYCEDIDELGCPEDM